MTALIFLGALAAAVFAFELLEARTGRAPAVGLLQGLEAGAGRDPAQRPTVWTAVLLVLLPSRFAGGGRIGGTDLVDMLRRAGYPYDSAGDFYAGAIRTLSLSLLAGGAFAGALTALGGGLLPAVGVGAAFVWIGLRRPYSRLRRLAQRRSAAMRNNMLTGLALMNALLSAGVSVQEALRRTAGIGGPFCNLLGLLVARMEVAPFRDAADAVEAHLPDPRDVEAGLFMRAVRDFYNHNRPILPAIRGLQAAVHREVVEATEARAALVRQRSGLFGVLAVLGLVVTIIAPFAAVFTTF